MTLNVALVGYGYVGKTFHAPLIASVPGLALHTVVSSDPAKVHADYPAVTVRKNLAAALADPDIALVVIATPNELHAPQAIAALRAGKHVVVDKPFTLSAAEAEEVIAEADKAGRLLSVFHNRRFDSGHLTLKRLIAEGRLGQIREFSCHYDRLRPIVRDRWREREGPGAGIWYDLAPHLIDQALQLFGRPQSLYADIQLQRVGAQAPDYFHAMLRYPETRVILHASMSVADNRFHLAAHGSGGSFVKYGLDRQEAALKAGRKPGDAGWGEDDGPVVFTRADEETETAVQEPITLERGDYRLYYAGVRDAIAGTGENPVTGEEALAVMELLELGLRSAHQRRELSA